MKKLVVAATMTALSFGAFAQGTIIFQNSASQLVTVYNGAPVYNAPPGTHVAFYYSPTAVTDPLDASMHTTSSASGTLIIAGRFVLGIKTLDADAVPGATIYASVRGWTGVYSDWDSAYAAALAGTPAVWAGYSPVFQMGTGGAGSPPSLPVALSSVSGFTGLVIGVPEPTTFALAGLGVGALLLLRRCRL